MTLGLIVDSDNFQDIENIFDDWVPKDERITSTFLQGMQYLAIGCRHEDKMEFTHARKLYLVAERHIDKAAGFAFQETREIPDRICVVRSYIADKIYGSGQ